MVLETRRSGVGTASIKIWYVVDVLCLNHGHSYDGTGSETKEREIHKVFVFPCRTPQSAAIPIRGIPGVVGTHELHWKCQWHSSRLLHHTRPFPFHPWPPIMPDPMHINYGTLRQNDWGLCCTPIKRCFVGNTAATNYMQSRLSLCATPTKSKGCRLVTRRRVVQERIRGAEETKWSVCRYLALDSGSC